MRLSQPRRAAFASSGVLTSVLALGGVAALWPPTQADGCSYVHHPWTGFSFPSGSDQPADVQLGFWHGGYEFSPELLDAKGISVPLNVRSWRIPWDSFYWDARAFSILTPVRRLAPGTYTLRPFAAGRSTRRAVEATFTVVEQPRTAAAIQPPQGVWARVVESRCAIDVDAGCRPITAACVHLEVGVSLPDDVPDALPAEKRPYTDPGDPALELTWAPMVGGRLDRTRSSSAPGFGAPETRSKSAGRTRHFRVPAWWFAGLQPSDSALWVELRWLAASGRRSPPASVIISDPSLLAAHVEARREASAPLGIPMTTSQVEDVARFARASSEDARRFFGLLAQPPVLRHPEANGGFESSRDQDGTAALRARVTGRDIPLRASLRIEGGRVHPPLTREQLAALLAQLPAPSADLGNLRLAVSHTGLTWIIIDIRRAGGHPHTFTWQPGASSNVGDQIAGVIRLRDHVEADPLFQALAARHVEDTRYFPGSDYGSVRFGRSPEAVLDLVYRSEGGRPFRRSLSGPLVECAVDGLQPVISTVTRQLGIVDHQQESSGYIQIEADGRITIRVRRLPPPYPSGGVTFEGRMGDPRVRRMSSQ